MRWVRLKGQTFILIQQFTFTELAHFQTRKLESIACLMNFLMNIPLSLNLQSFTISKHLNGGHGSKSSILKENQFRRVLPRNHSSGAWVLGCDGSDAQKINHNQMFGNNLLHVPCMNEHLNFLGVARLVWHFISLGCILYACIYVKTENCSS